MHRWKMRQIRILIFRYVIRIAMCVECVYIDVYQERKRFNFEMQYMDKFNAYLQLVVDTLIAATGNMSEPIHWKRIWE